MTRPGRPTVDESRLQEAAERVARALRAVTPILEDQALDRPCYTCDRVVAARIGLNATELQNALRLLEAMGAQTRP